MPGPAGKCDENPEAQESGKNQLPEIPSIVHDVLRSPGKPLNADTRAYMEERFGHDFSQVRVHTDARAAESALAVDAMAYTVGWDMVFAAGQFAPDSHEGRKLIAHELTHVVQQQSAVGDARVGSLTADYESEADQTAKRVISAQGQVNPSIRSEIVLARQPENAPPAELPQPKTEAVAEREREVIAIQVGKKVYVLHHDVVRVDGSSSWLARNPGNMDYLPIMVKWGAYEGKSLPWGQHRFAIFPTDDIGLEAVKSFLREFQGERNILLMMKMFAPAGDLANDPEKYAESVAKKLGVAQNTLVKNMTDGQLKDWAAEIKRVEGWQEGTTFTSRDDPALPDEVRGR
jgi:hypothetical protein